MQANKPRHIQSGAEFNGLFPRATKKDTVIRTSAGLTDTISLMQRLVQETKSDTQRIAKRLQQPNVKATCKALWNFVYQHIRYKQDQPGIEQVRRPARSWADRHKGVDCDCYTVFISSVLVNLNIPHIIRITKYNGRPNFQHVYPIVKTPNGQLTLDCVTDQFNHEVPYSDHKDFRVPITNSNNETLSGVDCMNISQIRSSIPKKNDNLPLREQRKSNCNVTFHLNPKSCIPKRKQRFITRAKKNNKNPLIKKLLTKQARFESPFKSLTPPKIFRGNTTSLRNDNATEAVIKTVLVFGIGYGGYQLFSNSKAKSTSKLNKKSAPKSKKKTIK